MLVLLVVACRHREVSWVVEHITLLRVDIHFHVRYRETGSFLYLVRHFGDRVAFLFGFIGLQALREFNIRV